MAREPRFVQVVPARIDELAELHGLDFVAQSVLARVRDEASWETGAITRWTTTGYAAEWKLGYRLLKRALDDLLDAGLVECTASRGHPGELIVMVYDELVRSGIDPGRSRASARAKDGRSRESAIGNRESARAQPRIGNSDQGKGPLDIEEEDLPPDPPTDVEVEFRRRVRAWEQGTGQVAGTGKRREFLVDVQRDLEVDAFASLNANNSDAPNCKDCHGSTWADELDADGTPTRCASCRGTGRQMAEAS